MTLAPKLYAIKKQLMSTTKKAFSVYNLEDSGERNFTLSCV